LPTSLYPSGELTWMDTREEADEEEQVHGELDRDDPQGGRGWRARCGGLLQARHQLTDVLRVEEQVRGRDGVGPDAHARVGG
jgi:hypothetical protein